MNEKLQQQIDEALQKKAFGFEYEETEIIASKNGQPGKIKKTKRVVPPDTNALYMLIKREKEKEARARAEAER